MTSPNGVYFIHSAGRLKERCPGIGYLVHWGQRKASVRDAAQKAGLIQ